MDNDFGSAAPETLAGAEIKGNAGPAPVIDKKFESDESFGV